HTFPQLIDETTTIFLLEQVRIGEHPQQQILSICRNGSKRERRNTRTQIRLGPGVVHCYFAGRSIVHKSIKRSLFVDIVYRVMARRELTVSRPADCSNSKSR